jgi:hypothetical protein
MRSVIVPESLVDLANGRTFASEGKGHTFESCRVRQYNLCQVCKLPNSGPTALDELFQRQPALRKWRRGLVNGWHATAHVALDRRARHRSVRAKHAAIAREGLEPFAAPFAVIEELAGIGRHRLDSLMAAFRASQVRLKLHIGHRE